MEPAPDLPATTRLVPPAKTSIFRLGVALIVLLWSTVPRLAAALLAPPNDNFAAAQPLAVPGSVTGSNVGATLEPGERGPTCALASATSVWYRVTPTKSGTLRVTGGSYNFDIAVALYRGPSIFALTELACGFGAVYGVALAFGGPVQAGQTYYLRFAGIESIEAGTFHLEMWIDATAGQSVSLRPHGTSAVFGWAGGPLATEYAVVRFTQQGATIVRAGTALPGTAGTLTDAPVEAGLVCYVVLTAPLSGGLNSSDALCWMPNTRSPTISVQDVSIALTRSAYVSFEWNGSCSADACILHRPDGSSSTALPHGTTAIGGQPIAIPTCFTVLSLVGGTVVANTDLMCAVPQVARIGLP